MKTRSNPLRLPGTPIHGDALNLTPSPARRIPAPWPWPPKQERQARNPLVAALAWHAERRPGLRD